MKFGQTRLVEQFPAACWGAATVPFLIAAEQAGRLYFLVCAVPAKSVGNPKKFQANREIGPG